MAQEGALHVESRGGLAPCSRPEPGCPEGAALAASRVQAWTPAGKVFLAKENADPSPSEVL